MAQTSPNSLDASTDIHWSDIVVTMFSSPQVGWQNGKQNWKEKIDRWVQHYPKRLYKV